MNDIEPPTDNRLSTGEPPWRAAGHEALPSARGYSLASLFLLVTAAGVISLLARTIVITKVEPGIVTVHAVVGGLIGGIVGAVVGAGYPRPKSCVGLG
ncbi:MAG: hypothetical protein ACREJM_10250, partial [Candidatus Saccharimonadales bacterium]